MTGLRVHGGAGGTVAVLEDLEHAAALLRRVGVGLLAAAARVSTASAAPGWAVTVAVSPASFERAAAALAAAVAGPHGLVPQAARAELLGDGVSAAAHAYRAADSAADAGLEAARAQLGKTFGVRLIGGALPVLAVAGVQVARGDGRPMYELTRHGDAVEWFADVLAGATGARSGGSSGAAVAGLLTAGAGALAVVSGGVLKDPGSGVRVHVEPAIDPVPVRGLADLVRRVPSTDEPAPRVRLERIDSARGRAWIVAVPGTSTWNPRPGADPFDVTSDVALLAGRRPAVEGGVVAAMREAGVRKGEPVMLAGHSLGGMIATSIAADPAARHEFTITHVVTTGAPVASVPVPADVQVLSLEHDEDVVPHLDGEHNPDRPSWVTVERSVDDEPVVEQQRAEKPSIAHDQELYAATAVQVDASADGSLQHWRQAAEQFLDPQAATVTAFNATLTRP